MNLKFWNKKPEPKTPSFRESVQMLAVLVAAVVASATAAYKAVILVFEVAYATPAFVMATIACGGRFLGTFWGFVTYVPRTAWAKLSNLIPARGATPAVETTATSETPAAETETPAAA